MRILSQDIPMINAFDIPYEMTMFSMSKYAEGRYRIYAQGTFIGNTSDDNFVLMSEYSTETKARKAMEMLRGAYVAHAQFKIMTEVQRSVFLSSISEKEQNNLYGLFQFPADDEVEV